MEIIKRDPASQLVYPTHFNLFDAPPTDSSVVSSDYIQIYPLNPITDPTNPITFNYQPSHYYVDVESARIHLEAKILNMDNGDLKSTDNVSVCEDLGASIFSSAELLVQNFPVFRSNQCYCYTNHFLNLIGYTDDEKKSDLTESLFMPETDGTFNITTNLSFAARRKITDLSKTFDIIRRPFVSMFDGCKRPLPPGIEFSITFFRSPDQFVLVGSAPTDATSAQSAKIIEGVSPYKLVITKAVMNIRRLLLHDDIVKKHRALSNAGRPYLYPFKHCEAKPLLITQNTSEYQSELIFSNSLPETIAIGIISQAAANGTLTTNPFVFSPHGLASATLLVEGSNTVHRSITFGGTNERLVLGYHSLLTAARQKGIGIDRGTYKSKAIIAFDLCPAKLTQTFQPLRKSTIRIDLKFHSEITENLIAIVWSYYDTIVSVDPRDKAISVDSMLM